MEEKTLKLLDALCEAYDLYREAKDLSGDGKPETFCNRAVQHVLARMGYDKFRGMLANQMVDFMRRSAEWEPVEMEAAQKMANDGRVVVAGVHENPHGHVAVIRPGLMEYSQKWDTRAPKVCQVGANSYIGKTLAWAFTVVPDIWVLKEGT